MAEGLFRLRFALEGETQVSRAFQLTEEALGDLAPAFRVIGAGVLKGVREQFATEGARGGGKWQPLSAPYKAWKNVNFPGRPILVQGGGMKGAMLNPLSINASSMGLVYEPPSDLAAVHQGGEGHMPQRRMVQLTAGDRRGWERTILTWIRHKQGRAAWPPPAGA